MKKLIYSFLITFISISGWSQSEDIFTFNLFNQMNFNPAYAGSKELLDAGLIYRNQWWSGVDGAPRTFNLYAHMPFAELRSGIGINLVSDQIGIDKIFKFGVNYAYRIKFSGSNTLAIGLGAQLDNGRVDWQDANDAVDPDNLVGDDRESKTVFNVGPGVYFKNNTFYLGVSVPRMLANSLYVVDRDDFGADVNTYFLQGGLSIPLSNDIELLPNAQMRYNPHAPFDFDFNLNLMFKDALMVGAAYRFEDSVDGLLVYQFNNGIRLGLAMDFTISELQQATTGSFELMLGYTFPCEDCEIKNLRYF